MSVEDGFKEQLEKLSRLVVVPPGALTETDDQGAKQAEVAEREFYAKDLHEQTVADRESARTQRETYARRTFFLVSVWMLLIFLLLLAQGFSGLIGYKPLSDTVLITLISSTTVNVIGTLIIVLKYIFKVSSSQ